jgi:hypothetical protein
LRLFYILFFLKKETPMPVINFVTVHNSEVIARQVSKSLDLKGFSFVFNASEGYDYMVVFDNLPQAQQTCCPPEHCLHIITEPENVVRYSAKFLDQFAWSITHQTPHRSQGVIAHHPGLHWHLGWDQTKAAPDFMSFDTIAELANKPKSKLISIICSKKMLSDEHVQRIEFVQKLKDHFGDKLDFYGRGFRTMADKYEAFADYRFHVVIENCKHPHYFSEKLADCLLTGTYPIYHGCPNLSDYYPEKAFAAIDVCDPEAAIAIIEQAITDGDDQKYQAELKQAQQLTLYKHNLFPMIVDLIGDIEQGNYGKPFQPRRHNDVIYPYNMNRNKDPMTLLRALLLGQKGKKEMVFPVWRAAKPRKKQIFYTHKVIKAKLFFKLSAEPS